MRQALSVMSEDAAPLTQRVPRAPDGRKQPRLQVLYLLASGPAQTRQAVAQLAGVHRYTVGRWLAVYEARGLEALLDL
jgi:transposase